ncbi:MAG: hypothetical protein HRT61_01195 [Ekhidna sp.]|nr:hypothetical protein [Ekhidna sp.]
MKFWTTYEKLRPQTKREELLEEIEQLEREIRIQEQGCTFFGEPPTKFLQRQLQRARRELDDLS